ncbi:hypothetical protein ACUXHY_001751 [Cytobacillus horneckiae]
MLNADFKNVFPYTETMDSSLAIVIGLVFSVLISHRGNLTAGLFMGYFYGYAAIGTYASLKTSFNYFRNQK